MNKKFKYTTTFIENRNDREPLSLYSRIFEELDKLNFDFEDKSLKNSDLIFHLNDDKINTLDYKIIDLKQDETKIIDTNIIMKYYQEMENKSIYDIMNQFEIPNVNSKNLDKVNLEEMGFPFVLKKRNSSQGNGIFLIENNEQLEKMKDFYMDDFENFFRVSKYIETESDYYNHYRIFTLGSGKILGSSLNYSNNNKNDLEKVISDDSIFDSVNSHFFLDRKSIVSNVSQGGNSIALNPNENSRKSNDLEEKILLDLDIEDKKLSENLEDLASYTAQVFSNFGFYILGQDWIQEKDTGKFYCLEVNYHPQTNIFNTLYNKGIKDLNFGRKKAAELIAKGIYEDLALDGEFI